MQNKLYVLLRGNVADYKRVDRWTNLTACNNYFISGELIYFKIGDFSYRSIGLDDLTPWFICKEGGAAFYRVGIDPANKFNNLPCVIYENKENGARISYPLQEINAIFYNGDFLPKN